MKSSFSIKGHPIHPMVVAVPIGLVVWTLAADIVYLESTNLTWFVASFWGGIGAIVAAVVAAIPGLGDLFTIARRNGAMRIGLIHMTANLIAVALFAIAAYIATTIDVTTGHGYGRVVALHSVAVICVGIAGWLGGEMVFKRRLAVHEGEPRNRGISSDDLAQHAGVAALPFGSSRGRAATRGL